MENYEQTNFEERTEADGCAPQPVNAEEQPKEAPQQEPQAVQPPEAPQSEQPQAEAFNAQPQKPQNPQPQEAPRPTQTVWQQTARQNAQTYAAWQQPAQPRPAPQQPAQPRKRRGSRIWIPIVIVAALILGIFGGAAGFTLLTRQANYWHGTTRPEEAQQPTVPAIDTDDPAQERINQLLNNANASDTFMTPAKIYSEYATAVVGIASEATGTNIWGQRVTQASSGTGFIITEDGYVLTNYHVVEGASNVTVQLYDGSEYPAKVVGYEGTTSDVALLKIEATGLNTVSLGDSDQIVVGEQVCTIGNPLGELTFSLTVGYLSAKDREINTDGTPINMLQTDCTINSGNSGGPLFDANGNVIGITTAKYSGSTLTGASIDGLNFAIPINDVKQIVSDLMAYGYVTGRPYLGISVGDSSRYGKNLPAGGYVAEVISGGAADAAGMKVGDVIVGMDESVIGSYSDLAACLAKHSAGDQVAVTVYRDGAYLKLDVTLGERPADDEPAVTEATEPEDPYDGFDGWDGWPFP